jgi:hypothetical protein
MYQDLKPFNGFSLAETLDHSFKTRPGSAGRPGTQSAQACGWAGSKQKTGLELAR